MKKIKIIGLVLMTLSVILLQGCVTQLYATLTFNNKSDYNITVDVSSLYTVISFSIETKKQEILTFEWPESVSYIEVDIFYYGPDPQKFQGKKTVTLVDGDAAVVDIENYPEKVKR